MRRARLPGRTHETTSTVTALEMPSGTKIPLGSSSLKKFGTRKLKSKKANRGCAEIHAVYFNLKTTRADLVTTIEVNILQLGIIHHCTTRVSSTKMRRNRWVAKSRDSILETKKN